VALRFLVQLDQAEAAGRLTLAWADARVHEDAWRTLQAHRDLPLSFADAATAAMARAHRVDAVLTTDANFARLGFDVLPAVAGA